MTMPKRIILIRHGESDSDKADAGRHLTPVGVGQIHETARAIGGLISYPAGIVSTPLNRTVESAKILSEVLNIPLGGLFPGLRVENIDNLPHIYADLDITFNYFRCFAEGNLPSQIPSPLDMTRRFKEAIFSLGYLHTLVIVGHGTALESFYVYQSDYSSMPIYHELDYGQYLVLEEKGL
jgi:broad specificity phosphatase PhoE